MCREIVVEYCNLIGQSRLKYGIYSYCIVKPHNVKNESVRHGSHAHVAGIYVVNPHN